MARNENISISRYYVCVLHFIEAENLPFSSLRSPDAAASCTRHESSKYFAPGKRRPPSQNLYFIGLMIVSSMAINSSTRSRRAYIYIYIEEGDQLKWTHSSIIRLAHHLCSFQVIDFLVGMLSGNIQVSTHVCRRVSVAALSEVITFYQYAPNCHTR